MEKLVKCDRHRQSSNNTFILQRTGGLDFLGMPHSISVGGGEPLTVCQVCKALQVSPLQGWGQEGKF